MNFKELAENLGLEEEEYLELVELFVETGRSDIDKLQTAIEQGDAEQAAAALHSLKGAAGNMGLMELNEIAKEIEMKARDNQLEGMAGSVQALKEKLDVIAELAGG